MTVGEVGTKAGKSLELSRLRSSFLALNGHSCNDFIRSTGSSSVWPEEDEATIGQINPSSLARQRVIAGASSRR
jgi:hypothetical protein